MENGWTERIAELDAALADREKRIGELEAVNDSLQDRLWLANVKIGELTAELNETTECCNCHIALEAANVKLTPEVGRLRDAFEDMVNLPDSYPMRAIRGRAQAALKEAE